MPTFTLRYARPNEAAIRTLTFEAENFARAMEVVRETDAEPESLALSRGWSGAMASPEMWFSTLAPAAVLLVLVVRRAMVHNGNAGGQGDAGDWTWIPLASLMAIIALVSFRGARRRQAEHRRFLRESTLQTLVAAGAQSTRPLPAWARVFPAIYLGCFGYLTFAGAAAMPSEQADAALLVALSMFVLGLVRASPATRRPYPPDLADPRAAA